MHARALRFALDDDDMVANYAVSTALLGRFQVSHVYFVPFLSDLIFGSMTYNESVCVSKLIRIVPQ